MKKHLLKLRRKKVQHRIIGLAIVTGIFYLLYWMHFHDYITIPPFILRFSDIIFTALGSFLAVTVILRFTQNRLFEFLQGEMDIEQRILISKSYSFFLYAIAFSITLWKAGVSVNNITLFIGLVTTGIAFALRDVLMNILAWLIILRKKPLRIQDNVKIGEEKGIVTRIGTFFITLEQDLWAFKIPNKTILEKPVQNFGKQHVIAFKLNIKEVPSDIEKRFEALRKETTKNCKISSLYLDFVDGKPCIQLEATLEQEDQKTKTFLVKKAFMAFADLVPSPSGEK